MRGVISGLLLSFFSAFAFGQQSPVMVELFTYDGCLNCAQASRNFTDLFPPGDSLLRNPVILLTYHVDYDDGDHFTDPSDHPLWRQRQKQYQQAGISDAIYTPQVIINGKSVFSGSNRARLIREINAPMQIVEPIPYRFGAQVDSSGKIKVEVQFNTAQTGVVLNYALVSKKEEITPGSGENQGRTIVSRNVVRDLLSAMPKLNQTEWFNIPHNTDPKSLSMVVFMQRLSDGQILFTSLQEILPAKKP